MAHKGQYLFLLPLAFFLFFFSCSKSSPLSVLQQIPPNAIILNVTEEGGVKRVNMASSAKYYINFIAEEGAIVLDGRQGPNYPRSWSITVELPTLSSPAFIDVYAAPGTDGILTIIVPFQLQEVYTIFLRNDQDKSSGSIIIRGLRVRVFNLEHLVVSSKSICQVNAEGNPGGADIVVNVAPTSSVQVTQLSSSFLSINPSVVVSQLRSVNALLVVSGESSALTVDASSGASSATLQEGCLSFAPNPVSSPPSAWFSDMLKSSNITLPTTQRCTILTVNTSVVEITVPTFYVYDLHSQSGINRLAVRASLSVTLDESTSAYSWNSASLKDSVFQLNSNLKLEILDFNSQVVLKIPQRGNNSLVVWCNAIHHPIAWTIGDTSSLNKIVWDGKNCRGNADVDNHLLSNITYVGTDQVNIVFQLTRSYVGTGTLYSRTISMNKNVLDVSLIQFPSSTNNQSRTIGTQVSVNIPPQGVNVTLTLKEDVPYDLRFDNLPIKPIIDLAGKSTMATFTIPSASSIKLLAKSLSYQKKEKTLKPEGEIEIPSSDKSTAVISSLPCFTPLSGCSLRRWVMAEQHGGTPCMTDEETSYCTDNTILVLKTSQSFSCNANASFSVIGAGIKVTNPELEQQGDDYDWVKIFISFYFFVAVITTGFGWVMSGTFIEAGWMALVITASLSKCGTESNHDTDLTTIAIQERSSEVVMNLFTGWYCESNTSAAIAISQVAWIIAGVVATVLIVIDAWKKTEGMFNSAVAEKLSSRTSRLAKYVRRVVATLMIWLLLPMIYHHLDTDFGSVLIGFSVGSGICLVIYLGCEIYLSLRLGREGKYPVAISVLNGIQITVSVVCALLLSVLSRPDVTSTCKSVHSISLLYLVFIALICSLLHIILMIHWWYPKWSLVLLFWRLSLKIRGRSENGQNEPLPASVDEETLWRTSSIITFCNRLTSILAAIFGIIFVDSSYNSTSSSYRGTRVTTFLLWLLIPCLVTIVSWLIIRQIRKPKVKKVSIQPQIDGDKESLMSGKGLMSDLNQKVNTEFNYDNMGMSEISLNNNALGRSSKGNASTGGIQFAESGQPSSMSSGITRPDLLTSVRRNF